MNLASETLGPVSYTHLDVYKRQVVHLKLIVLNLLTGKDGFTFGNMSSLNDTYLTVIFL